MHCREIYAQLVQLTDLATHSARRHLEEFLGQLAQALPPTGANDVIRLEVPLKQWEMAIKGNPRAAQA